MGMQSNDILKLGFALVVFWYVSRKTDIGRDLVTDVAAIPQQLGVAEGLKSAIQFTR